VPVIDITVDCILSTFIVTLLPVKLIVPPDELTKVPCPIGINPEPSELLKINALDPILLNVPLTYTLLVTVKSLVDTVNDVEGLNSSGIQYKGTVNGVLFEIIVAPELFIMIPCNPAKDIAAPNVKVPPLIVRLLLKVSAWVYPVQVTEVTSASMSILQAALVELNTAVSAGSGTPAGDQLADVPHVVPVLKNVLVAMLRFCYQYD
jgi:hypothetical protein